MKSGKHKLIQHYLEHFPDDAYSVLIKYPANDIAAFLSKYEGEKSVAVVNIMPVFLLSQSFKLLDPQQTSKLFNLMNPNLVSRIVRKWRDEGETQKADLVFGKLNTKAKEKITKLLSYSKDSIGAIMNPAPFAVSPNLTLKETLAVLEKEKNRYSRYIYIVDEQKTLLGVIPFKDVFYSSNKEELISKFMSKDIFSLNPVMKIKTIYTHKVWSKWDSLPVVGSSNELLGVLRYEVIDEYFSENDPAQQDDSISVAGDAIADVVKVGVKSAISLTSELFKSGRVN